MKTSKENSEHYKWGDNADGWHLVKNYDLHIIEELIPPKTGEKMHFHHNAQQFFRVLDGIGHFDIDGKTIELKPGEGIHVPPKSKHRIRNEQEEPLEIIIVSQPNTRGDREDV